VQVGNTGEEPDTGQGERVTRLAGGREAAKKPGAKEMQLGFFDCLIWPRVKHKTVNLFRATARKEVRFEEEKMSYAIWF